MSGARAPGHAMSLWTSGLEFTLDVLRLVRRLSATEARLLGPRLLEAASRLPVSIARAGSSREPDAGRARRQAVIDLEELEGLLRCVPGHGTGRAEVLALVERLRELKRRAAAAGPGPEAEGAPRAQPPAPPKRPAASRATLLDAGGRIVGAAPSEVPAPRPPARERGAALLIALVVSATLAALGLAVLHLGDGALRTAARARQREALREVAESGAHAVKRWFDAPASGTVGDPSARHLFLGRFDLRDPSLFDRERRLLDADGVAATPPVAADGAPGREFHRQGRLDLFHKPWRAGTVLSLLGTAGGPDLVLEDRIGAVDLLDRLSASLLDDQSLGRLLRIEIAGPQTDADGRRLGLATVTVTAAHYPRLGLQEGYPVVPDGVEPDGLEVVRFGLAEIPAAVPRGPLAACGDITLSGAVRARWGRIVAGGDIRLADTPAALDDGVASGFPYADLRRRIAGAQLAAWESQPITLMEDPWLKILARGKLAGWEALADQPFPHDPAVAAGRDHSNLFQRVAGADCPAFSYLEWKRLVASSLVSDRRVHHFTHDPVTGLFRERGAGPARSVRDWTHDQEGIFFFDTADGQPPSGSNLTPAVSIDGGAWNAAGLIYLHAASFSVRNAAGVTRVLVPPGEPCDDENGSLACDPGEYFVNLAYATTAGTGLPTDAMERQPLASGTAEAASATGEAYAGETTAGRDAAGLPIATEVNLFGILYNAGDIVAEGEAVHFGSLVAGGSIVQTTPGAPSPVVYFDDRIARGTWPPPEIAMPRTFITFWQTQHP